MATEITNRPTPAGICRQIGQLNNPNDARVKNIAVRQRLLTDLQRQATAECACKAFKAGRINGQQLFILGMSESECRGIIGSIQSAPENIAEAAGKIVPGLPEFLGELFQVNTWLRVAMVIGGGVLIIIGLLMLAKQLGLRK